MHSIKQETQNPPESIEHKSKYDDIENRGYGSLLLSECERYCRSQGMKYLQLEVYSDNKNAVAFYKKNKFEIIKSNKEKLLLIKEL